MNRLITLFGLLHIALPISTTICIENCLDGPQLGRLHQGLHSNARLWRGRRPHITPYGSPN
jgi:hypothetical protein